MSDNEGRHLTEGKQKKPFFICHLPFLIFHSGSIRRGDPHAIGKGKMKNEQ